MRALVVSRASIVWLILVAATLLSWESIAIAGDSLRVAHTAILAIAFLKVRLVGLEFMELRHAPTLFRVAFEAWVAIIGTTLIFLFW